MLKYSVIEFFEDFYKNTLETDKVQSQEVCHIAYIILIL